MSQPIRILLVEDDPRDAQRIMDEVQRGDIAVSLLQVTERQAALDALGSGEWGVIICDFSLPDMSALELLGWVRERRLDLPVIVLSTTMDEELAVMCMHAGAHDIITMDSLARLNPAIERELQEQEVHRQHRQAEAALLESEQNFRQLTESIPEVFWLIDCSNEQMLYLSSAFEVVWEQPPAHFMSQPHKLLETIHPEDYDRVAQQLSTEGWRGFNQVYRIVLPDGTVRWVKTRSFPVPDEGGRGVRAAGLTTDITEHIEVKQERELMSRALAQSADAVMITDAQGRITYVNPAFEELTGFARAEVLGQSASILKSGFQSDTFYHSMWSSIANGIPFSDIFINRRKDGELYYEAKTITPIRDGDGQVSHYVSTGKDITGRLKSEERLNSVVHYDAVTGLANRILLQDRLEQAILQCRRRQRGFGLLCLGVDLHELLGSGYDNEVVEQLSRQIAHRLTDTVAVYDTVARLDDGEFVILHKDHEHIRDEAEGLAKRLVLAFSSPITTEGYELFISPAIGISLYPDDGQEAEQLLSDARIAMTHARGHGHGGYSFFQGGMATAGKPLSS